MSTVSALGNRTLDQLKVPELKEELRKRGIIPKGVKKELMERLEQALLDEGQVGNFYSHYIPEGVSHDAPDSGLVNENDSYNLDITHNVEIETDSKPEASIIFPHSSLPEVKTEPFLVETISEAEDGKTTHPVLVEEEEPEERKTAVGPSFLVTTGFEIASSAGMETDVIVQSVPGFSYNSDLLPGTFCEAGFQSHPMLSACQVSANIHQTGESVEKSGKDVKVDQSGIESLQSEGHIESKSEQIIVVESVVLCKKMDEGNALVMHPEPEVIIPEVLPQTVDDTLVVTIFSEPSNHVKVDMSSISVSGSSAEIFEEKFVEFTTKVGFMLPEDGPMEDKTIETSTPEQISIKDKTVNEKSLVISGATVVTPDPLESASAKAFNGGVKIPKDMVPSERHDRQIEPRRQFEEKTRNREGIDVRREERDFRRSERESPRDRRELSRSRLSQEGIAKVKEEVEKARTKDRGRVESGFRRSEPRAQRCSIEEKVDARVAREELVGKGDLRRVDDESKARDVKPMDVDSEAQAGYKRKESGEDLRQVEPFKRQRRWNSGKNIEAEPEANSSTKSMTSDRVKTSVLHLKAETGNASSLPASTLSPVSSTPASKGPVTGISDLHFGSRHPLYASKTDDASNNEIHRQRLVPAPTRQPTTSLRIDRFLRPFTLNAVKDLLAQTGTFEIFWMDHIKSHCYVTYSTVEEAIATRNVLYNLQWPPTGGKTLTAEFVDPEEVKLKCQSENDKPTVTPVTTPRAAASSNDQTSALFVGRNSGSVPVSALPPPPPPPPLQKEKPILPTRKELEPAIPALDDLFNKTRAKPHIYFLPLTEEQVTAKLAKSKPSINKFPGRA